MHLPSPPSSGGPSAWRQAARDTLVAAGLDADPRDAAEREALLQALDARLQGSGEAALEVEDAWLSAAALILAETLVAELTLEWEEAGEEPTLRFQSSEVVLFPLRMVRAHVAAARRDGTPVRLARLVRSTATYLDHLVRYFPSRLGLARRSRGARRAR